MTTRSYPEQVNFRAPSGSWKPIDRSLETDPDGTVHPVAVDGDATIPSSLTDPVEIKHDGSALTFRLRGADGDRDVAGTKASFDDALRDVDVTYAQRTSGLKETLVLASSAAPSSYTYDLTGAENLTASIDGDGDLVLVDPAGDQKFRVSAPLAWDSAEQPSYSNALVLSVQKVAAGRWTLTMRPDAAWLNDPARVFPARLDPDFYWIDASTERFHGADQDCTIIGGASAGNSYCSGLSIMSLGYSSSKAYRDNMRFDVSSIPSYATITDAGLDLYSPSSGTHAGMSTHVKTITSNWDNNSTWNSRKTGTSWTTPGGDVTTNPALIGAANGPVNGAGYWYYWDVPTDIVNGWVKGTLPNYGLQLSADTENTTTGLSSFTSTDGDQASWPALDITWTADSTAPEGLSVTGQASPDQHFLAGNQSLNVTAGAQDYESGIKTFTLKRDGGVVASSVATTCVSGVCPPSASVLLPLDTTPMPEGAHTLTVEVRNAAGLVASTSWQVWVDRTAPSAVAGGNVAEFDQVAHTLTLGWGDATDPALVDGSAGSGVATYSARSKVNGGTFSAWIEFDPDAGYDAAGVMAGDTVSTEVRARDYAGNFSVVRGQTFTAATPTFTGGGLVVLSPTVSSSSAAAPPTSARTAAAATGIPGIDPTPIGDMKSDQCGAGGLPQHGSLLNDSGRQFDNILYRALGVFRCQSNAEDNYVRVYFTLCLQVQFGSTWKNFSFRGDAKCKTKKLDAGKFPGTMNSYDSGGVVSDHVCYPGTHSLRVLATMTARRKNGSIESKRGPSSPVLSQESCPGSVAWRYIAADTGSAKTPSAVLGDRLSDYGEEPPGLPSIGPREGFEAHHIVPAGNNPGAVQAQAYAYSCSNILPNQSINGVWLRGYQLRTIGEGGDTKSASDYEKLGTTGKKRTQHVGIHNGPYWTWIQQHLASSQSGDYECNEPQAASEMVFMANQLKDKTNAATGWQAPPGTPEGEE